MAADLYGAIDQAIAKINRSKEWSGLPVTLNRQDGSLYLRGIFPSKDGKGQPKRTRYPLGFKAVIPMLAHAEQKGRKIGLRLALGEFRWEDERPLDAIATIAAEDQPLTIAEWISHKELEYWQARAKTPDALENWRTDYGRIYDRLLVENADQPIAAAIYHADHVFSRDALGRFSRGTHRSRRVRRAIRPAGI